MLLRHTALRFFQKISPVCLFLAAGKAVFSQAPVPSAYSGASKINQVRVWEAKTPQSSADSFTMSTAMQKARITAQYIDGLGRGIQTVIKQGSMATGDSARDLVSAVIYDELGREQYKYLPFAADTAAGNASLSDGRFKLNAFQQQASFMQKQYGNQGETFFYGQTVFEPSLLNRVSETFAPGNSWVGTASETSEANRHSVKAKYWFNATADSVRLWTVTDSVNKFGSYATGSSYGPGQLYKNVTIDEHGKQVIEFKDKEGLVVLKKVQLTAAADTGSGKGYTGWLCTYYIYDDLNRLRCVIQPEGVKQLAVNSWAVNSTLLNEQCFRYEYDGKSRMILKKVPGAGMVYMVYDSRDRLVMTQDANLRTADKWLVTKYDELNRPTETGLWINNTAVTTHRSTADTSTTAYPNTASDYEKLTVTHYDN